MKNNKGGLAQLVERPTSHAEGHWFDSCFLQGIKNNNILYNLFFFIPLHWLKCFYPGWYETIYILSLMGVTILQTIFWQKGCYAHPPWRPILVEWWGGNSHIGSGYGSGYIARSAELALRSDHSRPIVSVNMYLVVARPPERAPQGGMGGRDMVELGKGHQHSIKCPFLSTLPGWGALWRDAGGQHPHGKTYECTFITDTLRIS